MKSAWIATYNNMDGEVEVLAVSESREKLEQLVLQRITEYINVSEDIGYDRHESDDGVTFRVGDKYFDDDTGEELELEPFEWYTLTSHELV